MENRPQRQGPHTAPQHQGLLPFTFHVQPGKGQTFQVLSASMVGVWTHWVGTRSLPCTSSDPELCHVDHATAGRRRWQGWIAVRPMARPQIGFLGLTEGALKSCPRLRTEKTLRGFTLLAWRTGKERQSKLLCSLAKPVAPVRDLLVAPLVEEFLCRLWDIRFNGSLPAGVEGYPLEQQSLNFGDVTADHVIEDPLKGTIWEGAAETPPNIDSPAKSREIWQKMRKEGKV